MISSRFAFGGSLASYVTILVPATVFIYFSEQPLWAKDLASTLEQYDAVLAELSAGGVPEKLARRIARLSVLEPALDIVALSRAERASVAEVARAYFEIGLTLGLDSLLGV